MKIKKAIIKTLNLKMEKKAIIFMLIGIFLLCFAPIISSYSNKYLSIAIYLAAMLMFGISIFIILKKGIK